MSTAIRILMVDREAGLNIGVCGILRLTDLQWWDGKQWGTPPTIPSAAMPGLVVPLAPLTKSGMLAGDYAAIYPTDAPAFGPVTGSIVAYVWNLSSGKFEGRCYAELIGGDDGPAISPTTLPTSATITWGK